MSIKVGMGGNLPLFTDIVPVTVTRIKSDKCICVKRCLAQLDPSWKPNVVVGGFAGHCVNNYEQKWIIDPNPREDTPEVEFTLRKNGKWVQKGHPMKGGQVLRLGERIKFHDYNF